jgi:hypothetical protein
MMKVPAIHADQVPGSRTFLNEAIEFLFEDAFVSFWQRMHVTPLTALWDQGRDVSSCH